MIGHQHTAELVPRLVSASYSKTFRILVDNINKSRCRGCKRADGNWKTYVRSDLKDNSSQPVKMLENSLQEEGRLVCGPKYTVGI